MFTIAIVSIRTMLHLDLKRFLRPLSTIGRQLSTQHDAILKENVDYEAIIGLEVHAQLQTSSKLFSPASTRFLARPNSQVAFFDESLPGTLPVLNRKAVELAILTSLALDCKLCTRTSFDRKHYFYGDMPNGYQITQQFQPIACHGHLDFIVHDEHHSVHPSTAYLKRCRLKQIQIEQDSGKSLVDDQIGTNKQSLIDLNRAGVPLLEFVFEPDLCSAVEAVSLVKSLFQVLQTIDVCSCRMEEGALRVDANISIRAVGSNVLQTRTEVKNLNSFRFIREAIDYEIERQQQVVRAGENVINETMSFDFRSKKTMPMRDKEIVQDYRFMPEPNLPSLRLFNSSEDETLGKMDDNAIDVAPIQARLPRLPRDVRQELIEVHKLDLSQIYLLMSDRETFQLFWKVYNASRLKQSIAIVDYLTHQLAPLLLDDEYNRSWEKRNLNVTMIQFCEKVPADCLGELIDLQLEGRISAGTSLDLIQLYLQGETKPPVALIDALNWWLITDDGQIEAVCRRVIQEHPKIARKFAKTGFRKPGSMLIQRACALLNNQVDESQLWNVFERILKQK